MLQRRLTPLASVLFQKTQLNTKFEISGKKPTERTSPLNLSKPGSAQLLGSESSAGPQYSSCQSFVYITERVPNTLASEVSTVPFAILPQVLPLKKSENRIVWIRIGGGSERHESEGQSGEMSYHDHADADYVS